MDIEVVRFLLDGVPSAGGTYVVFVTRTSTMVMEY